jgi:hypothetical protein
MVPPLLQESYLAVLQKRLLAAGTPTFHESSSLLGQVNIPPCCAARVKELF